MSAAPALLAPRALYPPPEVTRRGRWVRYGVAVTVAAALTALQVVLLLDPARASAVDPLQLAGTLGLPLVAGVSMRFRRRWPLPVALVTMLCGYVAVGAAVFAIWAYVSLCTRRDWRTILPAALLQVFLPPEGLSVSTTGAGQMAGGNTALNVAILLGFTLLGLFLGSQRDVQRSASELAANAHRERELAVLGERNRIAREMHDVLAHRMSLVSLNANVLAYRPEVDATETTRIAHVIEENARASLAELRSVLSALRSTEEGTAPQPTLAALPALVEEARAGGQRIEVAESLGGDGIAAVPALVGRHAYRIIQEALTNARKHAPDAPVRLRLEGGPSAGLHITVTNPVTRRKASVPGAGLGLLGLGERCSMLGGSFRAGAADGVFTVAAHLPWETP